MFHDICAWPIAIAAIGSQEVFSSVAAPAVERLFMMLFLAYAKFRSANGKLPSRRRGGMKEKGRWPCAGL